MGADHPLSRPSLSERAFWLTSAVVLVADFFSKVWVRSSFGLWESRPLGRIGARAEPGTLADFFRLTHVENPGIAFGIDWGGRWLYVFLAAAVCVAILVNHRSWIAGRVGDACAIGGVLSGAVGNLIDRLRQGTVTDFLDVGVTGAYRWPTFNVADSAIVVGVAYIVIREILEDRSGGSGA